MNADPFVMLNETLERFASVIDSLQTLNFRFGRIVAGNKVEQEGVNLNCINGIRITIQGSHSDVVVQEIFVGSAIRLVILPANVLQWYSIASWDRSDVIDERGFPIFPLDRFLELLWLRRLR